jgi:hypothetical protein
MVDRRPKSLVSENAKGCRQLQEAARPNRPKTALPGQATGGASNAEPLQSHSPPRLRRAASWRRLGRLPPIQVGENVGSATRFALPRTDCSRATLQFGQKLLARKRSLPTGHRGFVRQTMRQGHRDYLTVLGRKPQRLLHDFFASQHRHHLTGYRRALAPYRCAIVVKTAPIVNRYRLDTLPTLPRFIAQAGGFRRAPRRSTQTAPARPRERRRRRTSRHARA